MSFSRPELATRHGPVSGLLLAPVAAASQRGLPPVSVRSHTAAAPREADAELQPCTAAGRVPQQQRVPPGLGEVLQAILQQQNLHNQVHPLHLPAPESPGAVSQVHDRLAERCVLNTHLPLG